MNRRTEAIKAAHRRMGESASLRNSRRWQAYMEDWRARLEMLDAPVRAYEDTMDDYAPLVPHAVDEDALAMRCWEPRWRDPTEFFGLSVASSRPDRLEEYLAPARVGPKLARKDRALIAAALRRPATLPPGAPPPRAIAAPPEPPPPPRAQELRAIERDRRVLEILRASACALTIHEVRKVIGKPYQQVRSSVIALADAGLIEGAGVEPLTASGLWRYVRAA